jgi:hypothetical protein
MERVRGKLSLGVVVATECTGFPAPRPNAFSEVRRGMVQVPAETTAASECFTKPRQELIHWPKDGVKNQARGILRTTPPRSAAP